MAPHHTDVELKDIIDIVLSGRPHAVSFPAANAGTNMNGKSGAT
jgi:hypothetical protein